MNVEPLNAGIDQDTALRMLREYRQHRGVYDKLDIEIERIYRQIARGKIVISVVQAILAAGVDQSGNPKLAIAPADASFVTVEGWQRDGEIGFLANGSSRRRIGIPWPGVMRLRGRAELPRIPPQHRPQSALANYHILWEADWKSIPSDPYLLRKIGRDAYVVLAAWELTEVEMSVIRASRLNG